MAGAVTFDDRIWPRRAAQCLLSLTLVVATVAVLGRLIGFPWLTNYGLGNIPMAAVTSICFVALAATLLIAIRASAGPLGYACAAIGGGLVAACGLVVWLAASALTTVNPRLIQRPTFGEFCANQLAQVSPLTGVLFVLAGLAVAAPLLARWRSANSRPWLLLAAALGALIVAVAALVVISYVIDAPVLYDSKTLPMALPTAIAFVLQGSALIAMTLVFQPGSGGRSWRPRDVSVATQLGVGLGAIVLAVLVFGYVVYLQEGVLWAQTQALYDRSMVAIQAVDNPESSAARMYDQFTVGQLYREAARRSRALEVAVVAIFALVLLASAAVGWLLSRQISLRVRELTLVAAQFGQGNLDVRSASASANELGILAATLNQMADTVQQSLQSAAEMTERLRRSEASLAAQNGELEAFSYSVSHDLRAPLRSIDGFSRILLGDGNSRLGCEGRESLERICAATQQMGQLIDDLLRLSRLSRTRLRPENVDLSDMVREIGTELMQRDAARQVTWTVADGTLVRGDRQLLRVALSNLLDNAWKFTSTRVHARIEFGAIKHDEHQHYFVRDNGVGFDPAYADQLFGAFQRLHSQHEFPGSGIGLATVRRVLARHGGRIWAESAVDQGATFSFTLGALVNAARPRHEATP